MKGQPGRLLAPALLLRVSGWEALSEDTWSCGKVTRLLETALSPRSPSGELSQALGLGPSCGVTSHPADCTSHIRRPQSF